jgi:hypothetical protein
MARRREGPPEVEVSSDPERLAAVRAAAAVSSPPARPSVPFSRLIELLSRVNLTPEELAPQLGEATARDRERLRALAIGEDGASGGTRANAALVERALGDATAAARLEATLRSPELALKALGELVRNHRLAAPLLADARVAAALLAIEAGPDDAASARAAQLRLLADPLAELPPGTVERLARAARSAPDREDAEAATGVLARLVVRGIEGERAAAALALLRLVADPPAFLAGSSRTHKAGLAARLAGVDAAPILEALAQDADAAVAGEAVAGLARFRGREVLGELLSRLDDSKQLPAAAAAIGRVMSGSGDRAVVARLTQVAAVRTDGPAGAAIAGALLRIGGPLARATVVGLVRRLYPRDRQKALWALEGGDLERALERAIEAGLLRGRPDEALRARVRAEAWAPIEDAVDELWALLHRERAVLSYDAETSYPPRHERLLGYAAAASRGLFAPEAAQQEGSPEGVEHGEPAYRLSFVSGGRAYRVACRNYGDYYDSMAVLAAVHRALADLGRDERFVTIGIGGQDAHLLFGVPDAVRRFCECAFIPLEQDRAAWEREREALKQRHAAGLP